MLPDNPRIFRVNHQPHAKKIISADLDAARQYVFTQQKLTRLVQDNRESWGVLASVGMWSIIEFMQNELPLVEITLKGSTHQQKFTRYLWRKPTALEVASSLRSTAYLCHSSALRVHGLADEPPSVWYVNYEQSAKPTSSSPLVQASVDRAFRGKQRESTFAFDFGTERIVLLSGKHTNRLEVQNAILADGASVSVTSIERTLIDVTVRPTYAGGVKEVLGAYRRARGHFSISRLLTILKKLEYIYPFHQAIGFYLERAGYPEDALARLRTLDIEIDFYLAHNMKEKEHDAGWRIYHPRGM